VYARINSELRFPPAMLADMEAFVRENWSGGVTRKAFPLDLTGWPNAERRSGAQAATHDILALDPQMAEVRVIIYPRYHRHWKSRSVVGGYSAGRSYSYYDVWEGREDPDALITAEEVLARFSRLASPRITIMGGRGARASVRTLKHEMRHWTQQLLSILTSRPAGLPRKGAVVGKRAARAQKLGAYTGSGMDPYRQQREYVKALGIGQHGGRTVVAGARKEHAHARDPVEFYTRMGDLVEVLSDEALMGYAKELRIRDWGGRPQKPQKYFNTFFREHAPWKETIRALSGAFPRRHRKMVSEV